jgi:tape measure domain-containing protein
MPNFADITAALNLNISNFTSGLDTAMNKVRTFSSNLGGTLNTLNTATEKSKFQFKDVARIVQGIMLSKIFYSGLQSITSATAAVWEFNKSLEYSEMAYQKLFKDKELAEEFVNVLKDFAAITPFSFSESEAASKRLLAYGIKAKNVMYVMQGVMAASTMQNNPQAVETVSRAIGQIYTKGRLMNDEMRQLAEGGIPVYDILKEKLGLTQKQLQNLGNVAIPATTAINALVDGINERYGSVLAASAGTIKGVLSNISDNFIMAASVLGKPIIDKVTGTLKKLGEFLFKVREAGETKGAGGIFETLIPPSLQSGIRNILAMLQSLWIRIKIILAGLGKVFAVIGPRFLYLAGFVGNAILTIVTVLAWLVTAITNNVGLLNFLGDVLLWVAGAFIVFKVATLGALIITTLSQAVVGLLKVLRLLAVTLVTHPIAFIIALIAAAILAYYFSVNKAKSATSGLLGLFNQFNKVDPDKMLLPSQKDRANDLEKFNKKLEGTGKGMGNLADETGKAAKAGKYLQSFDEVFTIKPDDSILGNIGDGDLAFPEIVIPEVPVPEVPDFSEFGQSYIDDMMASIKIPLIGAGVGAVLGGLIGFLIGGPAGAKVGAQIGAMLGAVLAQPIYDNLPPDSKEALDVGGPAVGKLVTGKAVLPKGGFAGMAMPNISLWWDEQIKKMTTTGKNFGATMGLTWAVIKSEAGIKWEQMKTGWGNFTSTLGLAWAAFTSDVGVKWDNFKLGWNTVTSDIKTKWGTFTTDVKTNWDTFTTGVKTGWNEVATKLGTEFSEMGAAFKKNVSDPASRDWNTFTTTMGIFWDIGATAVKTKWADLKVKWGVFTADLKIKWGAFTDGLSANWDVIKTKLAARWDDIKLGWNGVTKIMGDSASKAWNAMVDGAGGFIAKIGEKLSQFGGIFKKWVIQPIIDLFNGLKVKTPEVTLPKGLSEAALNQIGVVLKKENFVGPMIEGHAAGGIFNREHIANFAEGNKKEAIIPLENKSGMQPFVDAVVEGVMSLAGSFSNNNSNQLQPLFVGTLIADERSLKELNRKMKVIEMKEKGRN